jgi:hypothetical protein
MTASAVAAIRAPLNSKAPAGRIQDPVDSRTYSGALAVKDQSVTSKPLRASAGEEPVGGAQRVPWAAVTLYGWTTARKNSHRMEDLRLERAGCVAGETCSSCREISAKGVDSLITSLSQRNKSNGRQEILTTAPATLRLPHSVTHDTASA